MVIIIFIKVTRGGTPPPEDETERQKQRQTAENQNGKVSITFDTEEMQNERQVKG